MKHKTLFILLVILLSIPAIFYLFFPGFFQTDDGEWMIIRFSAFYHELRNGFFPVRFLGRLNFGYGYPVANFLYPGFMYLGVPIYLLGFGFVNTIKIILGLSMVFSALFFYLWMAKLFTRTAALLGSLFYLYAPYHLYDLYTRGSVGEVLALAVVPFILWQIENRNLFLSSCGVAMLILSHNTLAILFLPIIVLYMLIKIRSSQAVKSSVVFSVLVILFGIGLSTFFWLPALHDIQYTIFSQTSVSDFAKYFADINLIGFSTIFIFGASLLMIFFKKLEKSYFMITIAMVGIGIIALLLSISLTTALWNILPVGFVQFPFRMLSIVVFSGAFLLASCTSMLTGKSKIGFILAAILLIIFSALHYISPKQFFNKGEFFYSTNVDTTTVKNEYMPKWVTNTPSDIQPTVIEGYGATISQALVTPSRIKFLVAKNEKNSSVIIHKVYFPGWEARVINGDRIPIQISEKGMLKLDLPSNLEVQAQIEVVFKETGLRMFANIVSLATIIVLFVLSYKKMKI